jgi:hypothetical protein
LGIGLERLLAERLPLNRKERFFTGTILPAIIGARGFGHVDLLLRRLGMEPATASWRPADTSVQFFTEYGFAESLVGAATKRFPTVPAGKDTPDAILYIDEPEAHLIAIEAKVFHVPSKPALQSQLAVQRTLLQGMAADLGRLRPDGDVPQLTHIALLPAQLAKKVGQLTVPTLTWQELADLYRDVAEPYWLAILNHAMTNYHDYVPENGGGKNAHAMLLGADIVSGFGSGDLEYDHVGCNGGLTGKVFKALVTDGGWRSRSFQVRRGPLDKPHKSWFTVGEFIRGLGELVPHTSD